MSWVGTITYMSPERISGDKYGYDSDVWSLGLTLVECALGRFPYPPTPTDPMDVDGGGGAGGGGGEGGHQQQAPAMKLSFWDLLHYIVENPPPELPPSFSPEFRDFVSKVGFMSPALISSLSLSSGFTVPVAVLMLTLSHSFSILSQFFCLVMGGMIVHKLIAVPAEGAWGAGQGAGPASAPLSDKVQGRSRERPGEDEGWGGGWGGGAQWGRTGGHGIVMMMKNVLVLIYTLVHLLCSLKGKGGRALSLCLVIRLLTTHCQNPPPRCHHHLGNDS